MNLTCTDYLLPKISSKMAENGTIRAHKEAQKGQIGQGKWSYLFITGHQTV